MLARRLVRHSFREGGSIARRRPPGRRRCRALRATSDSLAVAKWILSHRDAEFAEKKKNSDCLLRARFLRKWGFGLSLRRAAPRVLCAGLPFHMPKNPQKPRHLLPFATDCHYMPALPQDTYFRPFRPFSSLPLAAACLCSRPSSSCALRQSPTRRHRREDNLSTIRSISIFSTLFPTDCHPLHNVQPIAPKPLASNVTTLPLANLINY